jgi:ATP-dependent Lon protease
MYFNQSLVVDGAFASTWSEDGIGGMIELIVSEEEEVSNGNTLEKIPLLALRNTVLFPNVVVPITLKERQAMNLVETIYERDGMLGIIAQKNSETEGKQTDIYTIGTLAKIIKIINFPNGRTIALVHGKQKFQTIQVFTEATSLEASVKLLKDQPYKEDKKSLALMQSLKDS